MNAIDKILIKNGHKFDGETAQIDPDTIKPFAKSRKIYVQGSRSDIQVPFREISLSDTPSMLC
jgi:phosphomethylpyrimidine synthase